MSGQTPVVFRWDTCLVLHTSATRGGEDARWARRDCQDGENEWMPQEHGHSVFTQGSESLSQAWLRLTLNSWEDS